MNILILPPSGGSYNSLRPEMEIYIGLAKKGHNISIITDASREYIPHFIQHGIKVIHFPPKHKISPSSILLIRKTIKSNSIEIVYATNSRTIANAAFACIGMNVKLAVYRGTASGLYWHDPSNYLGMLNPRINGIICVSQYVCDFIASKNILKNKLIQTIHKGHDLTWYNKKPADLTEFGIKPGDFTAICVINNRPHKGLDIVLKASNKLAKINNFHLLLVGKGSDQEPYKSLIQNSLMQQRIHIAGYRNDAPELIAASDILIQPSTGGEGLPRAILESLAYGTPVLSSANPGSMEIIRDGDNGFIVPVGDVDAISNCILKLNASPEILSKISSNSKNIIKNEMSNKLTVQKHIEYFELLLNS